MPPRRNSNPNLNHLPRHMRVAPSHPGYLLGPSADWREEIHSGVGQFPRGAEEEAFHEDFANLHIGSVDCATAMLAFDHLWSMHQIETEYCVAGGTATYLLTRPYLPSMPDLDVKKTAQGVPTGSPVERPMLLHNDLSAKLAEYCMQRDTADADVDIDSDNAKILEKIVEPTKKKINIVEGTGRGVHLNGETRGHFELSITSSKNPISFTFMRHESWNGHVPFDIHLRHSHGGFSVKEIWPKLNPFDRDLVQRIKVYGDRNKFAGEVNIRSPTAIVMRKLQIHPRSGGMNGKQHKDLVDICKLFVVHNHEEFLVTRGKLHEKHVNLDPESPACTRLLQNVPHALLKELHEKAVLLMHGNPDEDHDPAHQAATYELAVIEDRFHGYQDSKVIPRSHMKIIHFTEDDVKEVAKRYKWTFGLLVDFLAHGLTVHPQSAHSLAKSQYWPRARAEFAGMGAPSSGGAGW